MKTSITKITALSVFVVSAMLLSACSEEASNSASNEVSVEEGFLLEGVAATGYAASAKKFYVNNNAGERICEGETNETGEYQCSFANEKANWPLDVVVELEESDIKAIVPDPGEGKKKMIAHVNQMTNLFAKKAEEKLERKEMTRSSLDSVNQECTQKLLGDNVQADVFVRQESFKAAQKGNPSAESSLEDMVLHTMGEIAERHQQQLETFIAEEHEAQSRLMQQDQEFNSYLAGNLVDFAVTDENIQQSFQKMYGVNLDESNTASAQMIQLKNRYQEILTETPECNQENAGTYAREMLYLNEEAKRLQGVESKTEYENAKMTAVNKSLQTMQQTMSQWQADSNCSDATLETVEIPTVPRQQQGSRE